MGYLDDDTARRAAGVIGGPAYARPDPGVNPEPLAGPIAAYGDPASGVMIPTNQPDTAGATGAFRPLDALNNLVRPDSTSAQSYRAEQGINVSLAPDRSPPLQPINPAYHELSTTPLSDALGAAPVATAATTNAPNPLEAEYGRQNAAARAAAARAKDEQDFMDRRTRMSAGADAANATTDLTRLQGEQRVARFNASNAALDVAGNIGGEGRYAAADDAAKAAGAVDADVAAAQGRYAGATARQNAPRNYIDEYVKQQQGLAEAGRAATAGQAGALDVQDKQLRIQEKKQLLDLRSQLAAETDPAKQRTLQDKILAIEGKVPAQDKVAIVQVDTGQKDLMGQPIYKNAAVNTRTGELVGGDTAAPKNAPKKPDTQDAAHQQAKAAIAAGAPLESVNKRLKEWGYATL